jgi:sigma-E factor negative regulatory protein RseC
MGNLMRESGTVVEMSGEMVKVNIKRHASCESCGVCGWGGKNELTLLVSNTIGAKVGDQVLLELPAAKMYQAALLVYTLPLMMLLCGFWVGQLIGRKLGMPARRSEILGIVTCFGSVALTYLGVHRLDQRRKIGARFQPQLVKIITSEQAIPFLE